MMDFADDEKLVGDSFFEEKLVDWFGVSVQEICEGFKQGGLGW